VQDYHSQHLPGCHFKFQAFPLPYSSGPPGRYMKQDQPSQEDEQAKTWAQVYHGEAQKV
jgi:hypothetical protein